MPKLIVATLLAFLGGFTTAVCADTLPADPTQPAFGVAVAVAVDEVSEFKLNSLLIGKQRIAVINGQRVREGEQIDGAKVISIQRQRVELMHQGESQVLTLGKREGFSKRKSGQ